MKKTTVLSIFILCIILLSSGVSTEAKGYIFKYKDATNNKTVKYNDIVPTYILNGKALDLSQTQPVLTENYIACASAEALFGEQLGADVSYNKAKKRLTISYGGHVLKLFAGKKECLLDDMESECPELPIRIKYSKSKVVGTLVPTRFVATSLGIAYSWDADTNTVTMTAPLQLTVNNEPLAYTGTRGRVIINENEVEVSDTPSVIISNNALICARSEVLEAAGISMTYNEENGIIRLIKGSDEIFCCIGSKITYINNILSLAPVEPAIVEYNATNDSFIYLPGRYIFEAFGFNYEWNSEMGTSFITGDTNNTAEYEASESADSSVTADNLGETEQTDDKEAAEAVKNTEDLTINNGGNFNYYDEASAYQLVKIVNPDDGLTFFVDKEDCGQFLDIPLAEGTDISGIKIEEDYMNASIKLIVPGNQAELFRNYEFTNTGDCILQLRIYYNAQNDTTELVFFSSVVLDVRLSEIENNSFFEAYIDYTANMHKKIIVIDAGHGGHDPGAISQGYNESDLNLKIVQNCKNYFDTSDIKVYYTRLTDVFYSLYERAAVAGMVGADMFIAIHHNSSDSKSANGTGVYYGGLDTYESLNGLTSVRLAEAMQANLVEDLNTKDNGITDRNFVVVRDSEAPAVLLEIGFMSNPDELSRLVSDSFSKKAAKAIYKTVKQIYKNYK